MIGIIGALNEEVNGLLKKLVDKRKRKIGDVTLYSGTLNGVKVVVALSGVGKVNASLTASIMLSYFKKVKAVINIGVAGGLLKDARQGDLILSTASLQHDFTLNSDSVPAGQIAGFDFVEFKSNEYLLELSERILKAGNKRYIRGTIASGDAFINSNEKADQLRLDFNAAACDMESAAIAHVCYRLKTPFISLRAVSDSADNDADLSFNEWLLRAAKENIEFIDELIKNIDEEKL